LAAWFRREKAPLKSDDRRDVPTDVFDKCPGCGEILYTERLSQNLGVCPDCGHHTRISAERYLAILFDEGTFQETEAGMRSGDPLLFNDLKPYSQRLLAAEKKIERPSAVITGKGEIGGIALAIAVMDFRFIGGSMGSVVGEKIARAGRLALKQRLPFIIMSASGGARMQEGIFSLMQMAKTSGVLGQLHEAGLPYLSILTDPTTGGVTASYAMLGDVNIAEPGALIGFAGPRVIEETIRQELPEGFQRAEFLLEHGMIDCVVDRRELKRTISQILRHMLGAPALTLEDAVATHAAGRNGHENGRNGVETLSKLRGAPIEGRAPDLADPAG
jgi:acetyl-CoA carboxylase carboxyl transferase subunit beta